MASPGSIRRNQSKKQNGIPWIHWAFAQQIDKVSNESKREPYGIGSMYAIYRNIYVYHQYTPNFSIYTIHGSYGYGGELEKHLRALEHQGALKEAHGESYLRTAGLLLGFLFRNQSGKIRKRS